MVHDSDGTCHYSVIAEGLEESKSHEISIPDVLLPILKFFCQVHLLQCSLCQLFRVHQLNDQQMYDMHS